VSSANRHSSAPATTVGEAQEQLGAGVSVYLDGGPCADSVPSTILDLTGTVPRMLRAGAVSIDQLRKVVPVIDLPSSEVIDLPSSDVKPAEPHPLAGGDAGTGP
jgi:hypothetical protein